MFAENGTISKKQCMRLLFFDLIGIATILLPGFVSKYCKEDGMLAILLGFAMAYLYLLALSWLLKKCEGNYDGFIKRGLGEAGYRIYQVIYGMYDILFGGFAIYLVSSLIQNTLLKNVSFSLIAIIIYILLLYAIYQGIEVRARVYEVLFYIILIPFVIMLLLGVGDIRTQNLGPLAVSQTGDFVTAIYGVFIVCSILQMLLMTGNHISWKDGICAGRRALGIAGILVLFLYLVLLGVFGAEALLDLKFPAVELMSTISFPGGFLRRGDAFMVAVWFFTIFAAGASGIYYGSTNLGKILQPKEQYHDLWHAIYTYGTVIVSFLVSQLCYLGGNTTKEIISAVFAYLTPFFLALPFLLVAIGKKGKGGTKRKSAAKPLMLAICLSFGLLMSGCSVNELENKSFPLTLLVGENNGQCRLAYKYQDLSKLSGKDDSSKGSEEQEVLSSSFYQALRDYENKNNKIIDVNHAKAVVIEEAFLEDEVLFQGFIDYLTQSGVLSRNILLFVARDTQAIDALQKDMSEPLGNYLEEMVQGNENFRTRELVTLGSLLNEQANQRRTLVVPYLSVEEKLPVIDGAYIMINGEAKRRVDKSAATWGFIFQGTQAQWDEQYQENYVHLQDLKVKYEYPKENVCKITLFGKCIRYGSMEVSVCDIENNLQIKMAREISNARKEGIDLTNSYDKLTWNEPNLARKYQNQRKTYEDTIQYEYHVSLREIFAQGSIE